MKEHRLLRILQLAVLAQIAEHGRILRQVGIELGRREAKLLNLFARELQHDFHHVRAFLDNVHLLFVVFYLEQLHALQQQFFLVVVKLIERALRDTHLAGNIVHAHSMNAIGSKSMHSHVEDASAQRLAIAGF